MNCHWKNNRLSVFGGKQQHWCQFRRVVAIAPMVAGCQFIYIFGLLLPALDGVVESLFLQNNNNPLRTTHARANPILTNSLPSFQSLGKRLAIVNLSTLATRSSLNGSLREITKWIKRKKCSDKSSLEWRRLNRVNEILQTWTPPQVIERYYSIGQTGYDKFGCPLWISAQGPIDIRGIMQSTTKKELMRFMIYIMEKNALNMREKPERCSSQSICVVADMEHLSMWQMAYRPVSQIRNEMVSIYEANYPENLRRIFIINAPKLFTVIYNMMRPFMNQVTIDKICVYGFDKDEWQSALLKDIEADQLPAHYGGTMTDPATGDPKCPHKLNMGGEVPHSYYVSNSKPVPKEGMQSLEIGSGSRKNLEFEIGATNSVLRWEFMTEGGDIGFRIYHVAGSKQDIVEVVPVSRIESHLVMEEGEIICDYIGKYVVEFENSFSFFKSKKVYYNVELAVK